ncbi:hypothetical protein PGT21_023996 [Puccinia graminis f. sp. tritici]|uniref:Uncharacterized protein n=1 Tax=Puccinia graminis f. sp. tritici TaxID=56615 RepID=A0A5B0MFD3_PUCGR|nr:hypothetical protein PGT21_023996 [Puccinia graminis f. sp. tritici]
MHFPGHQTKLLLSFCLKATRVCASSGTPLPTSELLDESAGSSLRDAGWSISSPGTDNTSATSHLTPNQAPRQIPSTSPQVGTRLGETKKPVFKVPELPNMEPGYKAFMKSVQTLEYQSMHFQKELAGFKDEIVQRNNVIIQQPTSAYRTKAININFHLIENVTELQAIHSLMPTSARDRLFKLFDKGVVLRPLQPSNIIPSGSARIKLVGSRTKVGRKAHKKIKHVSYRRTITEPRMADYLVEREVNGREPSDLDNPINSSSRASGGVGSRSLIPLQPGELRGDVLDVVMDMVTWGWLERLNALLHKIMPLESALKLIRVNTGDSIFTHVDLFEHLLLQQCVFRTVELTYIYRLIPLAHLKRFLQFKDTLRLASINLYESWKVFRYLAGRRQIYFHGFHYSKKFVELVDQGIEQMVPKIVIDKTRHSFSPFY